MNPSVLRAILVLVLLLFGPVPDAGAQLLANEDNPSLIDQILQVVWEPSSLIRMWVGLDQLFNIARSWGGVARTLATLPFSEGRSMEHVRIQQPRRAEGRINAHQRQSSTSHWERFNQVYTGSKDSAADVELKRYMAMRDRGQLVLPPPYLFQPQEVFLNPQIENLLRSIIYNGPFNNRDDLVKSPSPVYMIPLPSGGIPIKNVNFESERQENHLLNEAFAAPAHSDQIIFQPQAKLNMFLKLMKKLGELHMNKVNYDYDSEVQDV